MNNENHIEELNVCVKDLDIVLQRDCFGGQSFKQMTDVNIKWKVSMAVSSNDVKNLNQPMITMMIVTTDKAGNKNNLPIEMTTSKFKEFFRTVGQINTQMENAKIL